MTLIVIMDYDGILNVGPKRHTLFLAQNGMGIDDEIKSPLYKITEEKLHTIMILNNIWHGSVPIFDRHPSLSPVPSSSMLTTTAQTCSSYHYHHWSPS